jgi:hypothetical protein
MLVELGVFTRGDAMFGLFSPGTVRGTPDHSAGWQACEENAYMTYLPSLALRRNTFQTH